MFGTPQKPQIVDCNQQFEAIFVDWNLQFFLIDNLHTIEVGGHRKSFEQIKDMDNSYLAVGDIEIGNGKKIPLWLFGFLY